jgi:hypothetical protein
VSHINTILYQLQQIIPGYEFEKLIEKYNGEHYVKKFSCKSQLTTMLYAQATGKDSLRDIQTGLMVNQDYLYHLGIKTIAKSTLAHANAKRNCKIYEDLFYRLLGNCRDINTVKKFKFSNKIYALDSTTIDLCLSLFPWARFKQSKGAIKIHPLLNLKSQIPEFIVITDGKQADVKVAKNTDWPLSRDSILVFDRGYIDSKWFSELDSKGVTFVTRAKSNMDYVIIGQHLEENDDNCMNDDKIMFKGYETQNKFYKQLRRIEWIDKESGEVFVFITNNLVFSDSTIADIYKSRWLIELFFKWIKQNLKIKTFLGTSENAVKTQIWIAMIYYLLLCYIKYQTKYSYSLLEFTRIISESLFFRRSLIDLLSLSYKDFQKIRDPVNQLSLF